MKNFEIPAIEVLKFAVKDIIASSNENNLGPNDTEWG